MRLPLDLARPSSSTNGAALASSQIGLSAFYVVKSMYEQHHFLEKRVAVDSRHQWVVDLVLCCLSFVGSLTIIVPYILTKQSRKLRHSLILGLATSDLASSSIIIATTSVSLAGGNLTTAVRFCQFAGYFFQVAVWTQNLWNLSIAIITYMILVHPLSAFNAKVERYLIWFWPAFWSISFAINSVGFPVTGFANSGGYCGFSPAKGGAYFSSIFQFIPRAFVVLVIAVLYTHLFFFLRRVNMFNRMNSTRHQLSSTGRSRDSHRQRTLLAQEDAELKESDEALVARPTVDRTSSMLYKWKRTLSQNTVRSPVSDTPRQGSGSSQGKSSIVASNNSNEKQQLPVLELDDHAGISPKTILSDIPSSPSSPSSIRKPPQTSPQIIVPIIKAPPPALKNSNTSSDQYIEPTMMPTQRRTSTAHFDLPDEDSDEEDENKRKPESLGLIDILKPMPLRRDVRDFGVTSTPREHLKHYSLSPAGVDYLKKAKEGEGAESSDRTLNDLGASGSTEVPSYESMLGQNWTWGMPVGGGAAAGASAAGEKCVKSQIATAPTTPSRSHFRPFGSRRQSTADHLGTGTNNSNSTDDNGVESLGSTLNRQASILLLLYPLAYSVLFSISIIRVIVDISNPTGSEVDKKQRSANLLHTIARWTIFAQGAIDALVFQFVERSFRMRMKRKRRIAAGEVIPDFWMDAWYKKTKNFIFKSRKST